MLYYISSSYKVIIFEVPCVLLPCVLLISSVSLLRPLSPSFVPINAPYVPVKAPCLLLPCLPLLHLSPISFTSLLRPPVFSSPVSLLSPCLLLPCLPIEAPCLLLPCLPTEPPCLPIEAPVFCSPVSLLSSLFDLRELDQLSPPPLLCANLFILKTFQ